MKKLIAFLLLLCLPAWAGRGFTNSTGDVIVMNGSGTALDQFSGPMTISFWMYPTSITPQNVLGRFGPTTANQEYLFCIGNTTFGPASGNCFLIGTYSALLGVFGGCGTLTANHWYNVVTVIDTAGVVFGSPAAYNTVQGFVTCAGTQAFRERRASGTANFRVNCADQSAPTFCYAGSVAEVAVWNVPLTLNEVVTLATVCPDSVRRTSLVAYYPLYGAASPEPDLSGGVNNGTVTGTTVANHAPCIHTH